MIEIEQREYQDKSIELLRQGLRDGHIRQVLVAPTGSGKSVIMLQIIQSAIEKDKRCMFVCERRNLVEQFSKHLDAHDIEHGILMANHWRYRPDALVQVASAQTLEKMESWPAIDFVFLDELHVLMRKSIINMIEKRPSLKIIGATATPFNPLIAKYFSNVVSVITMRELVDSKKLVPFRVFVAHEIDTNGVKTIAGEWQKDELEKRGQQIVGDIVSDYLKLSMDVFGGFRKTICFSCGIAHGAELVRLFSDVGVNAVQLASGVDDDYKNDVLAEFAKPESSIDMLISVDMLARGYDQTDIKHVILARPLKKSFSHHVQTVGRGARSHDGKDICLVQDHSGNWLRFLNDWNDLYHNGVTELNSEADKKPRKEPTEKQKEAAKCPKCGCIWPCNADICLHCGHVRQRRNDAVNMPGEMLELTASNKPEKFSSEMKESWYQMMLGYCRNHNKKEGCAFFWYQEKFKVKPSWKKQYAEPDAEVSAYCLSRLIKFAKSNLDGVNYRQPSTAIREHLNANQNL